jgi:N6-L-threonylcarbamoyladenine synthase
MSLILAIDTSCDDTSAAIVKDGREYLSNIVSSQNQIHEKYGGIVPELASRRHMEIIWQVTSEALSQGSCILPDLSAIAVCKGPGLIGSLIVGCQFAKAIAYSIHLPLIAVNHLEGHIFSAFLLKRRPEFPFLALVVSGGHTSLYRIDGFLRYIEIGRTRDDAAGEAYDKVAKMLGLGFPGGPIIDLMAKTGNSSAINFPRGLWNDTLDFSFSGLKTAVKNYISNAGQITNLEDICASFQKAVIDVLIEKTKQALNQQGLKRLVIAGGVAANSTLCRDFTALSQEEGIELFIPPVELCTDNAAMIGAAGHLYYENKMFSPFDINPEAYLPIGRAKLVKSEKLIVKNI